MILELNRQQGRLWGKYSKSLWLTPQTLNSFSKREPRERTIWLLAHSSLT